MQSLEERRKTVKKNIIDSISAQDAERIGKEVGAKAGAILQRAEDELNAIFGVYGLRIRTAVQIINESTGETTDALTF